MARAPPGRSSGLEVNSFPDPGPLPSSESVQLREIAFKYAADEPAMFDQFSHPFDLTTRIALGHASKEDAFERHRDETRDDRRVHVAHWVARLRRHARSCADVAFSRNSFAARSRRVRDRGRADARRGASCVSRCVL